MTSDIATFDFYLTIPKKVLSDQSQNYSDCCAMKTEKVQTYIIQIF